MIEDTFLYTKYPNLFDASSSVDLINIPLEWHSIIDHMCGAINQHITEANKLEVIPRLKYRYKFYSKYWRKIRVKINKILDPTRNYYSRYGNQMCTVPIFEQTRINNTIYSKLYRWIDSVEFKFFNGYIFFERVSGPHSFKIKQIKEKYNNLTVYYYNADEYIRGIIGLARHIAKSNINKNEL